MSKKQRLKEFKKTRIDFEHDMSQAAEAIGYSKNYIYLNLKYPNENPEAFQKIKDYVAKSGRSLDNSDEQLQRQ